MPIYHASVSHTKALYFPFSHPFDTIKVRLQTQSITPSLSGTPFSGGVDCVRQTIRKEGFLALYKGMSSPLYTSPAINAVVFTAYEQGKRLIQRGTDRQLTMNEMALAGAYAGFVNCFIACPVELIKAKLQVQYEASLAHSKYKGSWDTIKQLVRADGPKAIFKGMSACILREIPAYIAQFYTYESMKKFMENRKSTRRDNDDSINSSTQSGSGTLSSFELMLCGGVSGMACWTASYPQDVIKSRIQVAPNGTYKARFFDGGFIECGRAAIRAEGWRGLFRGFGPCMLRAAVANAAGFSTYEYVLNHGRAWQHDRAAVSLATMKASS